MLAEQWIKKNELESFKIRSKGNDYIPLDYACKLMQEYAFEAWKSAENNGRKHLSSQGNLDINGSTVDFNKWLDGYRF
jgi:hypothetical protein